MVEIVKADDIFSEAKRLLEGRDEKGEPCEKNLDRSEALLNEILSHNIGNIMVLYVLGSLHLERGNFGLAIQLLSQITQSNPQFGEAWNNLAMAYRGANDWERAVACCKRAAKLIPNPDLPCNISGLHLNRHQPEEALKYAEAALAMDANHIKAQWHKAVALLELRRWGEAWEPHDSRLEGGANYNIALRNYHGPEETTPWWDGKTKGTVVIHGEQGMGDEVMFASCIKDAIATGAKIILEPSPRLAGLFQRSFPKAKVFGTNHTDGRDWIETLGKPDFKCAIGSLPRFYRRKGADFPGTPYLVPDPDKKAWWAGKLRELGPKPKIGLAWQGGVQSTRNDVRSFHPLQFAPIFEHDVDWISLQYDKTARANVEEVKTALGVQIVHWPKAVEATDPETKKPNDLDDLAALISGLDMVISVCQTAIHFAGALGVPCLCLTPSQPSWRYSAVESEAMPWYGSVKLIRQAPGTCDWAPVIDEIDRRLIQFLYGQKATA